MFEKCLRNVGVWHVWYESSMDTANIINTPTTAYDPLPSLNTDV